MYKFNKIQELIDSFSLDEQLKIRFIDFLKSSIFLSYEQKILMTSFYSCVQFLSKLTLEDLNWENLCFIMNNNAFYLDEKIAHLSDKQKIKIIHNSKLLIEGFYIYLLEDNNFVSSSIDELKKYKHLIQKNLCNKINGATEILNQYAQTNYPINSLPSQIYQIVVKEKLYNINLNTKNPILIDLLSKFIDHLRFERANENISVWEKVFLYYFEESFEKEFVPKAIIDFNYKAFETQFNFYSQKEGILDKAFKSFRRMLCNFYIFLQNHIFAMELNHFIFKNSPVSFRTLEYSNFVENFQQGFKYIEYNPLSEIPKNLKWWLNIGSDSIYTVASSNINMFTMDFKLLKKQKLVNDLKDWIWNGNGNIKTRANKFGILIEFLNYISILFTANTNNKNTNDSIFSFQNIMLYMFELDGKYSNTSTKRSITIGVKSFLTYNKKKYSIPEKALDLLTYEYEDKEGTPISKKDFQLILDEFRIIKNTHKYGYLLFNIFVIFSTTNLRIGEILNLERNCIQSTDADGNGTIRLKTKTSSGHYVVRAYDAETIKLIKLSTNLTNELVDDAPKDLKNFIFISKGRQENITRVTSEFGRQFYNIVRNLENKLDMLYKPYDLRHTFINAIYDDGVKNNVPIVKLQEITGNKYNTVMKHYRRKLEIKDYVETFSNVLISEVDINGTILLTEEDIKNNAPVMGDLGVCSKSACLSNTTMCLACKNFFTTIQRIPIFEDRILYLKEILSDNQLLELERQEYEAELKLYATYLSKMLTLKNGGGK